MEEIFKMADNYQRNRRFENVEETSTKMFRIALILFISNNYPLVSIHDHEISFDIIDSITFEVINSSMLNKANQPYFKKLKPIFSDSFIARMIEHYPEKML